MRLRLLFLGALLCLASGCPDDDEGTGDADVSSSDATSIDAPAFDTPTDNTDEAETTDPYPADCDVLLTARVDGSAAATLDVGTEGTLTVTAFDRTGQGVELLLASRCPDGPIVFTGLENENGFYDYYLTCAVGACAPDTPPERVEVPADGTVHVTQGTVGSGECGGTLAAGQYTIAFALPAPQGDDPPTLCSAGTITLNVE